MESHEVEDLFDRLRKGQFLGRNVNFLAALITIFGFATGTVSLQMLLRKSSADAVLPASPAAADSRSMQLELETERRLRREAEARAVAAQIEINNRLKAQLESERELRAAAAAGVSIASPGRQEAPELGRPAPWPAARRDAVLRVIHQHLAGFGDPRLHIAPDIPRYKIDNVAELHDLDPSKVLLLYDDGLSKGGKTGFCITEDRVCWRYIAGEEPRQSLFSSAMTVRIKKGGFWIDGHPVSVTMARNPRRAAEVFGTLVEAIRDVT